MVSRKSYKIDGEDSLFSGTNFPGEFGLGKVGFEENSITHPAQVTYPAIVPNTQPIINLQ